MDLAKIQSAFLFPPPTATATPYCVRDLELRPPPLLLPRPDKNDESGIQGGAIACTRRYNWTSDPEITVQTSGGPAPPPHLSAELINMFESIRTKTKSDDGRRGRRGRSRRLISRPAITTPTPHTTNRSLYCWTKHVRATEAGHRVEQLGRRGTRAAGAIRQSPRYLSTLCTRSPPAGPGPPIPWGRSGRGGVWHHQSRGQRRRGP